jgi:hypothetical protein
MYYFNTTGRFVFYITPHQHRKMAFVTIHAGYARIWVTSIIRQRGLWRR